MTTGGPWTPEEVLAGKHLPRRQPRVLVDFDGVIHAYTEGWKDGAVYDPPMLGAREGLEHLRADGYEVVIFSTRDADQIVDALARWGWFPYRVTNVKEPAVCMIDDRAIRFTSWAQALADVHEHYRTEPRETT